MLRTIMARAIAVSACACFIAACSSSAQNAIVPQTHSRVQAPVQTMAANAQHRSLADFLAAQGSCITPEEQPTLPPDAQVVDGCVLYVPFAPNFEGWGVAAPAQYCSDYTVAAVDYAGVVNRWLVDNGHASLGTTISGSVNEKRNPDGSGEVDIVMNAHNALAWGGCDPTRTLNFVQSFVLLGNKPDAVLAGATPALANADFRVTYTEKHYGDPLQDLMYVGLPTQDEYALKTMQFHASAVGPLSAAFNSDVPPGTPGQMVVGQNGTFNTHGKGAIDGFTAEFIHITEK